MKIQHFKYILMLICLKQTPENFQALTHQDYKFGDSGYFFLNWNIFICIICTIDKCAKIAELFTGHAYYEEVVCPMLKLLELKLVYTRIYIVPFFYFHFCYGTGFNWSLHQYLFNRWEEGGLLGMFMLPWMAINGLKWLASLVTSLM